MKALFVEIGHCVLVVFDKGLIKIWSIKIVVADLEFAICLKLFL
ncbi:hypothetical protein PEDI_31510 [Persicobacter diffluens]|uniref:Uncharacterized protein n=1 Tax=Persicobacter diffluens TaxID=981 RepID=A0AAN4W0E7_9BACT|nr:hypothetical protein PEDI_31510 [Persicobacter diffluens]